MIESTSKSCWYHPTPGWLVLGLLAIEGLLWLSGQFQWFSFNHHKGWTVLIAVASVAVAILLMLLWFAAALLCRWRFQFSIRSLLVLVVAVALPFSWLAVEMRKAREKHTAVETIRMLGGNLYYDYEIWTVGMMRLGEPPSPAWLGKLLGDDFFNDAVRADLSDDSQMEQLEWLPQVKFLSLENTRISDAGLQHLEGLTQLECLNIENTRISDAGLSHLAGLAQLRELWLSGTQITDAGLVHLAGLPGLQLLWLDETPITDSGLSHLAGLPRLQVLNLINTKGTDAGVKKLQQALPNCRIRTALPIPNPKCR